MKFYFHIPPESHRRGSDTILVEPQYPYVNYIFINIGVVEGYKPQVTDPRDTKFEIVNPLNAELNPIRHLLALLGAHHILHVNRIRVKGIVKNRSLLTNKNTVQHKVKVKVTLVQVLRLSTGRTAHRGSRGIALLFHDQRHQKGVRGQRHAPAALYPRGKTRYPLYRRLGGPQGWSGQVWKISTPTGIRFPDRPARSHSLYRLSYRAHTCVYEQGLTI